MSLTKTTRLPTDRSAPGMARQWVSEHLDPLGLDPRTHATVVLLTSELVTNAVLHTDSAPTLTLAAGPDAITIGVRDSSAEEVRLLPAEPGRLGGWGLQMVDTMAHRWGERRNDDGTKVVWFEVANVP